MRGARRVAAWAPGRLAPRRLAILALAPLVALAPGRAASPQAWQRWEREGLAVLTAAPADAALAPRVLEALVAARLELRSRWGLDLPAGVVVRVHPDLASYRAATGLPWYVAAAADRAEGTVHLQRLRVLQERGGFERALRHEAFHLAQPSGWPRWLAEGRAMRFAGEAPAAPPLRVPDAALDRVLAAPADRETLLRAMSAAYERARTVPWPAPGATAP